MLLLFLVAACLWMWYLLQWVRELLIALRLIFSSVRNFNSIFGRKNPRDRSLFFFFFCSKETHSQEGLGSQTHGHLPFPLDFCHIFYYTRCVASNIAEVSSLRKTSLLRIDWSQLELFIVSSSDHSPPSKNWTLVFMRSQALKSCQD